MPANSLNANITEEPEQISDKLIAAWYVAILF